MKHHYIMYVWTSYDAVCRMGSICAEQDLHAALKRKRVKAYKLISVDDEPVSDGRASEWQHIS